MLVAWTQLARSPRFTLRLENCVFEENEARNGGGLALHSAAACLAVVSINDTIFLGNTALVSGGGLMITNANSLASIAVSATSTQLLQNQAMGHAGGGMFLKDTATPSTRRLNLTLRSCTFDSNTAAVGGGPVRVLSPGRQQ